MRTYSVTALLPLLLVATMFTRIPLYSQQNVCNTTVITLQPRMAASPPITALTSADFRVKVGGKTTQVESIADRPAPVRVSLLLDTGANQSQATWAATKQIVQNLTAQLPAGIEFAVITLAEKAVRRPVAQNDSRAINDDINSILPSKAKVTKEVMIDAISAGIRAFGEPRAGDVEIFVTASEENFAPTVQGGFERVLSQSGVRLIGVSFDFSKLGNLGAALPSLSVSGNQSFSSPEAIATSSGGVWLRTKESTAIAAASVAAATAQFVTNFFVVQLHQDHPLERVADLKVELVRHRGISRDNTFLRHPLRLYPCR